MPELWVPGAAGQTLEDFVSRIHRKVEEFMQRRGLEQAVVEVTLHDGTRFALHSISAEPGYGLVTLCPFPEDEDVAWPGTKEAGECPPEEMIVPVGSIMRIVLSPPEERSQFGFVPPPS